MNEKGEFRKTNWKNIFLNYKIMKLLYMRSIPMKPGRAYTLLSYS